MTEFRQTVLDVVRANPGILTGDVHRRMPNPESVSPSSVTRALNTLYRDGFVRHPKWNQPYRWEVRS